MAGTNSLEIEIHNLFQENASVDYVCTELIARYQKNETLSSLELEGISHLLITAGKFNLLQQFYIKCLNKNKISQLPVGYVTEILKIQNIKFTEETVSFLNFLIKHQPDDKTCLQSLELRKYFPAIEQSWQNSKTLFQKDREQVKAKLIEQISKNRLYQSTDQEQANLQLLAQLFPNDIEVGLIKQSHLERKAEEILSRFVAKKTIAKPTNSSQLIKQTDENKKAIEELEKNIRSLAIKLQSESPDQLYNLGILSYQFDLFELTLEILEKAPPTRARDWLMAEVLHECGRYLDLLKIIESLESSTEAKPDDTHGAIYLKALAYYGLGQKEFAIRLLHSLSRSVPFYRSTEALLHEWTQS